MAEQTKPVRKPSFVENFMSGAKQGFYVGVEQIAPAMVMAYALIQFLKLAGLMPIIGKVLAPVMGIFGLPGEASVVLLAAFFAKAAGAATAASMVLSGTLTPGQATILYPACILFGTLIGHFARIILVSEVKPKYYPLMFAAPILDAILAMFITRALLAFF